MNKYLFLLGVFTVVSCNNGGLKGELITQKALYQEGQQLFKEHCKSCHHDGMIYIMMGPALGYSLEKRETAWIRHHIIKGSYAATEDNDSISIALRAEGWSFMPGYHFLEET
jgi:mono/diheme cytochrome c family protein